MTAESTAGRRRGRPKKGKELQTDQIFEAAVACFAEFGFDKCSLRAIADRAGVDVALISYHYGSKLGLWTAVVDAVADDAMRQLKSCREASMDFPPQVKIHRLCIDLVSIINRRPLFSQLFISEIMTSSDTERRKIIEDKIARPVHDVLLRYILEIREGSEERKSDASLEIVAATSLISSIISSRDFLKRIIQVAEDDDRLIDELALIAQRILI
ncbi:TetR/AcrR family transcriptional regulator [Affinirhizobium pseudoryzae]|uniref:TetR/AcrR family transcriptional regulator n=1 Tax=Allorhizobium pseudoryzae TaxID=379684 RepID=UPI0013EBAE92|nr:TetR/AcrR family transcriptional regulator [Allorhizobium pseudoryzae]